MSRRATLFKEPQSPDAEPVAGFKEGNLERSDKMHETRRLPARKDCPNPTNRQLPYRFSTQRLSGASASPEVTAGARSYLLLHTHARIADWG